MSRELELQEVPGEDRKDRKDRVLMTIELELIKQEQTRGEEEKPKHSAAALLSSLSKLSHKITLG